jgi:hypothetical protein
MGELKMPGDDVPKLGTCCMCETEAGVTNIIMLSRRAPMRGHGWGCVVCDLPMDGAYAVLCDKCLTAYQAAEFKGLKFVCRGYPASDGRVPFDDLAPGHFDHDMAVDHG